MRSIIVIPARYGSTRFPGKPLVDISGKSMVQRVWEIAQAASWQLKNTVVMVATDDERILKHCKLRDITCVMTAVNCSTGTDRVFEAVNSLERAPDIVLNLQGDAPLTSVRMVVAIINQLRSKPSIQLLTAITQLSWERLDELRSNKQTTPFSGTTVIVDKDGKALWFSKQIIPAIRNEISLRNQSKYSPVHLHHGIYGYRLDMLKAFVSLAPTQYEQLEGLEQLRLLEHGYPIQTLKVEWEEHLFATGIDTLEDAKRAAIMLNSDIL